MLAWIMKALGFGGCRHDWVELDIPRRALLLRCCRQCYRLERFEPDCGGWTSGHWDEVR